jgi:hypothetical protein
MRPAYIWRYGDIDVLYRPDLDGAGSMWAPSFVAFIKRYFGASHRFGTVFEWCAGPAFIGFALLAEDMCSSLCVADINPAAVSCIRHTVEANQLHGRVRSYVSDNLTSVPGSERFDLVVGNPPNWYAINPKHPFSQLNSGRELRNLDRGWKVHAAFYSQIASFLNPGAFVLVQEVEPSSRDVFTFGSNTIPWDIRPDDQATIFTGMIRRGGLTHVGDFEFHTPSRENIRSWLQLSQKRA